MDGNFIKKLPKIAHIFLSNNRWSCDARTLCNTLGVIEEIDEKDSVLFDTMTCLSPALYTGENAENVFKTFNCTDIHAHQSQVHDDGAAGNVPWISIVLIAVCLLVSVTFQFVLFLKA